MWLTHNLNRSAPIRVEALDFNISAPHMHATCLEALALQPGHKVGGRLPAGRRCCHSACNACVAVHTCKGHVGAPFG